MKKPAKIATIGIAGVVGLVVAMLVILPFVLRGRVAELIRSELDERLDARVNFEEIDLSLLSTFPTLTAEVVGLQISGKGVFEGKTLLDVRSIGVGVDLFGLVGGGLLVVESITIDHPTIHVLVSNDGVANYDIVKDTEGSDEAEPEEDATDVSLQLRLYRVIEGTVTYDAPGTHVSIDGLNHDGSATLTGAAQTLASKTTVDAMSVRLGRVTYLKKAKVALAIEGTLRAEDQHVVLRELNLSVNELSIGGTADVQWTDEALDLDAELASPKGQSIKALVSAVPNAYAADFDHVQASGRFSVGLKVKGRLGPSDDDIPSFLLRLAIDDGTVKYPDLPLPLTGLVLDASATHPGGNLDKLRIEISKYGAQAGKSHVSGSLNVTTPISQPTVELILDAHFDMAEIAKAYPIPDMDDLRGVVTASIDLAAKGDDIKRLNGDIRASNIVYRGTDAPAVQVKDAHVVLSPKATKVEAFRAVLGRTDVALTGSLSPFTAFLADDQIIAGSLQLTSRAIYVDDFLSDDEDPEVAAETTPFLLPDQVDAKLTVDVQKLVYGDLVLSNFRGAGRVRNRKLTLSDVKADALGGSMQLSGTVTTPVDKPATFDMSYKVDKASFAEAFQQLPSMRAYAPIARFLDGRFSTDLKASGQLGEDGAPKLRSIDANGLVMTLQSKLGNDFKPLAALSDAVPAIPKPLDLSSLKARFSIEDGAVKVSPFQARAKGLSMTVSGSHGLDQEMSYRVSTDLPVDKVTGALAKKVQGLGLDLSKVSDVEVLAKVTGSITRPKVSIEADTDALRGAVAEKLSAELEAQRQKALLEAAAQSLKIIGEAEKRAAQIRKEARSAADKTRKEGNKRADQLVAEAGSNTFKQAAAKEGAKRVRKETNKRADQLVAEADKRAAQIVAEAKKRAEQLRAEADAQSERAVKESTRKIAP